jgi:hypothetical protein
MSQRREKNEGPDPEEAEELNRTARETTFFQQRWWRWLVIALGVLIVASLILPMLWSLGIGGN